MAPKRTPIEPGKKSNKFRLVVFEGDLSDGSISEIAQALTSALRPSVPTIVRQISNGKTPAHILTSNEDEEAQPEEDLIDASEVEEDEQPETSAKQGKAPRPKFYKNPEWVELSWNGTGTPPVSLKEFAKEKGPTTKARKYLVAAYWLKEHAGHPNVNIDQMYSCFKTAGWSVGFKDWRQTFDNLTRTKHLRKAAPGEFTITTLGEGVLQTPEA